MPKIHIYSGPNLLPLQSSAPHIKFISSANNQGIPFSTVEEVPLEEKPDLIILNAHGTSIDEKFEMTLFDFEGNFRPDFVEQLILLQQKTKATNFCIFACFAGLALRNIQEAFDSKKTSDAINTAIAAGKLHPGTVVNVFASHKYPSFSHKNNAMIEEIIQRSSLANEPIDYELLSLKYAMPYKSLKIDEVNTEQQLSKRKSSSFKYPEKYKEIQLKHENQEKLSDEERKIFEFLDPRLAMAEFLMRGEFTMARKWFDILNKQEKRFAGRSPLLQDLEFIYLFPAYYVAPAVEDEKSKEKKLLVDYVLNKALDNDHTPQDKSDFLKFFISVQDYNMVEEMLKNDANPNILDKDGYSALYIAVVLGYETIVENIIKNGQVDYDNKYNAISFASVKISESKAFSELISQRLIVDIILKSLPLEDVMKLKEDLESNNDVKEGKIKSVLMKKIDEIINPPSRLATPSDIERSGAPLPPSRENSPAVRFVNRQPSPMEIVASRLGIGDSKTRSSSF